MVYGQYGWERVTDSKSSSKDRVPISSATRAINSGICVCYRTKSFSFPFHGTTQPCLLHSMVNKQTNKARLSNWHVQRSLLTTWQLRTPFVVNCTEWRVVERHRLLQERYVLGSVISYRTRFYRVVMQSHFPASCQGLTKPSTKRISCLGVSNVLCYQSKWNSVRFHYNVLWKC